MRKRCAWNRIYGRTADGTIPRWMGTAVRVGGATGISSAVSITCFTRAQARLDCLEIKPSRLKA